MNIMMKSLRKVLVICLVTLSLNIADSDNIYADSSGIKNLDPCSGKNISFEGGEELIYKLYYQWNFVWLPAGEVTFRVIETTDFFDITAVGKTYPSYEWFYKVNDFYRTKIDKQTMLPILFERDIHEGKYKFYNRIEFDQETGKTISYEGASRKQVKEKTTEVNRCMHDMMSIIYYMRNIQYGFLDKNDKIPISIFLDGEVWSLSVNYKGKEKNTVIKDLGKFNTIKISPEVIAGHQFKDGTSVDIWVSDDHNKIPLLIESPVSVGSVKAVLKSHKGLKHPFASKIK
jgi:hypothetical protein